MDENKNGPLQAMDELVDQIENLHSSPTVALKIFSLLKDPEFQVSELEKCLGADPALAAAILRLVNSSRFGLSRKISSLGQAVTLLGTRSLRLAVLSFGLIDRLTRGTPARVCQNYWRRALTMAAAASRLCRGHKTVFPDEAYTAGLLADTGVLLFAQAQCDRYVSLCEEHTHGPKLIAAEREHFTFDHTALGARLLARWNLSDQLTHAVKNHHTDCGNDSYLQRAVRAGDMMTDALWVPQTTDISAAQHFLKAEFGLDLDGFISLAVDCKNEIQSSAETFRVELEGTIDCKALLKQAQDRYRSEAMEATLDLDSLTAVVEGDYS